jgi:nucleotide-binding universal stress UspA family protein
MKILICSDGSEQAERAVQLGSTLASGCQAEVSLLGIIEAHANSDALLQSLQRGQAALQEKGIRAELITKAGDPVKEIVGRTSDTVFDLVVIGTVPKSAGGSHWISSKSYKLIKEIVPPVMSVAGTCTSIKRVLICSGGKRHVEKMVLLIGQIARGAAATATLLHVMPEPPGIYAGLPHVEETVDWLLNSNSELGINLRHEKEALEAMGVSTQVILRQGSVLKEILKETRDNGHDLVVTGSALGRSLRTYVLGDITREIVNRAQCAVLVVRSEYSQKRLFPL